MKAVIQRVTRASVKVAGEVTGEIGRGILVLLGVGKDDDEGRAAFMADKCLDLRLFPDPDTGKPDRSVRDIGGGVLVVSQFTLYGETRKGRRPDFTAAAGPELANRLYEYVVELIRAAGLQTETGVFGALMAVELVNDGPFTLLLER